MTLLSKNNITRCLFALSIVVAGTAFRVSPAAALPKIAAILSRTNSSCSGNGSGNYVAYIRAFNSNGLVTCDLATTGNTAYANCFGGTPSTINVNVAVRESSGSFSIPGGNGSGSKPFGSGGQAVLTVGSSSGCQGGGTLTATGSSAN